jgi:hypothetical protein
MRSSVGTFALMVSAVTLTLASVAGAGEVQARAVPKPVMDSVKARFKTAKYVGAAKEKNEADAFVYEVTLAEKGMNIDLIVTPEGAITLIEKEIARKSLPKAVSDTLNVRYPKAKYQICEEVYTVEDGKETLAYYEAVLVDPAKQTWAVELEVSGAVRKIENKTGVVD